MDFPIVVLFSLAIGLVIVIGGLLAVYMSSLVKNAYELKVEIKSDMEEGLKKVADETDKKSKWIKRDLIEEIEKIKAALQGDNQHKFAEMADNLLKRLSDAVEAERVERTALATTIEGLRHDILTLDQRMRTLRRDQQTTQSEAEIPQGSIPISEESTEPPPENSPIVPQPTIPDA